MRFKDLFSSWRGGVWGEEPAGGPDDVVCVRVADFDWPRFRVSTDRLTLRAIDAATFQRCKLEPGDVVIEKSGGGDHQHVGRVALFSHEFPAVCSNFTARLRPALGVDPRFACYAMAAAYWTTAAAFNKQTTGIQNLELPSLLAQRLPGDGSGDRQRLVADFLDRELAVVDAAVEAATQLDGSGAELLAARRAELLGEGGRRSDDRALPWSEDVPLRSVARMGTGHTPSRSEAAYWVDTECVIPWITLGDAWQLRQGDGVVYETVERISPRGLAKSAAVVHPPDTVVLSRTATVGLVGMMGTRMATSQAFVTWTCGPRLVPRFLYHVLMAHHAEFERLRFGSTHPTIDFTECAALRTPLPTLERQHAVAAELDALQAISSRLAEEGAGVRDRLREYRPSLIVEAVAGQLDPRRISGRALEERLAAAAAEGTRA